MQATGNTAEFVKPDRAKPLPSGFPRQVGRLRPCSSCEGKAIRCNSRGAQKEIPLGDIHPHAGRNVIPWLIVNTP